VGNVDNVWDQIVETSKTNSAFSEEDKILAPLLPEIDLIESQGIQFFVRSVLLRGGPFWSIPSSFSGRYHPPDEHGFGGNVLHTKRVVRIASLICESHELEQHDTDIILAACILHDINKGVVWEEGKQPEYDPMHPYTVDKLVNQLREDHRLYSTEEKSSVLYLKDETMYQILRLIRCHMGPWSPIPETVPITNSDMIVHLADNIASKLHTIIDGDDILLERWLVNDSKQA
jgi:HD superfamily phosphohydrolase YqeK